MYQKKCYFFISENLQFCVKGHQPLASLSSINHIDLREKDRELLLPSCFSFSCSTVQKKWGATWQGEEWRHQADPCTATSTGRGVGAATPGVKLRGFAVRRQQRFHRHKRRAAKSFFPDWNQEVFNCKRPLTSQEKASAGDKPTIGQDVLQLKVWGCTLKRTHPLRCKGHATSQSQRDRFQKNLQILNGTLCCIYTHRRTQYVVRHDNYQSDAQIWPSTNITIFPLLLHTLSTRSSACSLNSCLILVGCC